VRRVADDFGLLSDRIVRLALGRRDKTCLQPRDKTGKLR
jgi:hypothetical protein